MEGSRPGLRFAATSVLVLVGAVAVGDRASRASVLPTVVAALMIVGSLAGTGALLRGVDLGAFLRTRWARALALVLASMAIVVTSLPGWGVALVLFLGGALLTLVVVAASLVLLLRRGHRVDGGVALVVALAACALSFAVTDSVDVRLHLVADRLRHDGDALLADPPREDDLTSPAVGGPIRSDDDGVPAVLWTWLEGRDSGEGPVYSPRGASPEGLRFWTWAAYECEVRIAPDIWWCRVT